jgi:hypothetical protein
MGGGVASGREETTSGAAAASATTGTIASITGSTTGSITGSLGGGVASPSGGRGEPPLDESARSGATSSCRGAAQAKVRMVHANRAARPEEKWFTFDIAAEHGIALPPAPFQLTRVASQATRFSRSGVHTGTKTGSRLRGGKSGDGPGSSDGAHFNCELQDDPSSILRATPTASRNPASWLTTNRPPGHAASTASRAASPRKSRPRVGSSRTSSSGGDSR